MVWGLTLDSNNLLHEKKVFVNGDTAVYQLYYPSGKIHEILITDKDLKFLYQRDWYDDGHPFVFRYIYNDSEKTIYKTWEENGQLESEIFEKGGETFELFWNYKGRLIYKSVKKHSGKVSSKKWNDDGVLISKRFDRRKEKITVERKKEWDAKGKCQTNYRSRSRGLKYKNGNSRSLTTTFNIREGGKLKLRLKIKYNKHRSWD